VTRKIGAAIERHKNGRSIVRGIEPGSRAEAMPLLVADEITHVGRASVKQIPPNEEIDFPPKKTVTVLRAGKIVRLTVPPVREKPSLKFTKIARAIETADINQVEGLARQVWSCDDLSDDEKAKLGVAIDQRRQALRRGRERELPLPAVGVPPPEKRGLGPPENYYEDKEEWLRQIAADSDLKPLECYIANIIAAKYVSKQTGAIFLCVAGPKDTVSGCQTQAGRCRRGHSEIGGARPLDAGAAGWP
jgi:hypothetical protein